MGWRDITNATNERTVIASVLPLGGADDTLSLLLPRLDDQRFAAVLLGLLNSMPLDFVAQRKAGGTHIRKNVIAQFPVPSPGALSEREVKFVTSRVVELSFTSDSLRDFARDVGCDREAFSWNPDRRAILKAELDAYMAYLYGFTRRELEYILDPKAVMGEQYPSETFRVLKDNEIKEFGEFRTQRLVLEAWDGFAANGTFDPARLQEPQYIDRVAQELTATRARLEQIEHDFEGVASIRERHA